MALLIKEGPTWLMTSSFTVLPVPPLPMGNWMMHGQSGMFGSRMFYAKHFVTAAGMDLRVCP